ncbi:hypothetical protein [Cupriavidus necator]|uniref:hypothetical protein n=1 Tax=Cupriavidus necator TaxID=106590 RepID=UPI00278609E7|nr:hypothetical protein [Cupriavidus necator]MDQ0143440.1 putative porin [Cupriavidus necator]
MYDIVSTAVRYTSNPDGHHHGQTALVSGGMAGSRLDLKGDEDWAAASSLTLGRQYNALNNIGWAFNPLDAAARRARAGRGL